MQVDGVATIIKVRGIGNSEQLLSKYYNYTVYWTVADTAIYTLYIMVTMCTAASAFLYPYIPQSKINSFQVLYIQQLLNYSLISHQLILPSAVIPE